jgi:hypothetical protein
MGLLTAACLLLQAEALFRQFKGKKEMLQKQTKEQIMDKYGSAARAPDEEVLALGQSEAYVEYNAQVVTVPHAPSGHVACSHPGCMQCRIAPFL